MTIWKRNQWLEFPIWLGRRLTSAFDHSHKSPSNIKWGSTSQATLSTSVRVLRINTFSRFHRLPELRLLCSTKPFVWVSTYVGQTSCWAFVKGARHTRNKHKILLARCCNLWIWLLWALRHEVPEDVCVTYRLCSFPNHQESYPSSLALFTC